MKSRPILYSGIEDKPHYVEEAKNLCSWRIQLRSPLLRQNAWGKARQFASPCDSIHDRIDGFFGQTKPDAECLASRTPLFNSGKRRSPKWY